MRIRVIIDASFEVETPEDMMRVSADLDAAVSKLRERGTATTSFRQWRNNGQADQPTDAGPEGNAE